MRIAVPSDVPEIARIQRVTWRTAYAELLPPEALTELEGNEPAWVAAVADASTTVHVAAEGDHTVGFCVSGPAPAEEAAGADGTPPADASRVGLIGTLLVEPRWGRRGHGGRLLVAAATALREAGAARGITWVPERDEASRSCYARAGWEPDGTVRTLDAGGRPLRELRLTGTLELSLHWH